MLVEVQEKPVRDEEYAALCKEVPNAAARLDLCLRGHDIPASLVQPIHDLLEALAPLLAN